jgi:hypothetical protein
MGLIAMSERDLQRIEILSKVIAGRLTLVSAAHVLDLRTRPVRRLLERISTGGAASIRHKAIGRPSNNRISDANVMRSSVRRWRPRSLPNAMDYGGLPQRKWRCRVSRF